MGGLSFDYLAESNGIWKQKTIKTCLGNNEQPDSKIKRKAPQVSESTKDPVNQIWTNAAESREKHRQLELKKNLILKLNFVAYDLCNFKQVISTSLNFITVFISAKVDYWICKCEVLCKRINSFKKLQVLGPELELEGLRRLGKLHAKPPTLTRTMRSFLIVSLFTEKETEVWKSEVLWPRSHNQ